MVSDYPVLRIWENNQAGHAGDDRISLQEGGCRLLLYRPGLEVEIHALDMGEYPFLAALSEQATLAEALEQAFQVEGRFDLTTKLGYWFGRGLFTHFSV